MIKYICKVVALNCEPTNKMKGGEKMIVATFALLAAATTVGGLAFSESKTKPSGRE